MSDSFLDIMRKNKRQRLGEAGTSIDKLREKAAESRMPHQFSDIFSNNQTQPANIIAEIKFSSPSLGVISSLNNPVFVAEQYLKNGACAISVLTEEDYFNGSLDYLSAVREAFPKARMLMKDFILDESQLLQARIHGADAILLIAAFLSFKELQLLYQRAIELNLTPLIEVHSANELKNVETLGPSLIGINNRDLQSLKVDLNVSRQLLENASSNAIFISESGINTGGDIYDLKKLGYHGFLIGGKFMASSSPGPALSNILSEVSHAR